MSAVLALVVPIAFPPLGASTEAQVASLFSTEARAPESPHTGVVAAESAIDEIDAELRYRVARLDRAGLDEVRDAVVSGATTGLRLNLFHGVKFEAAIERSAPTASGYSLSGPLKDVPFGGAVLVVNEGMTLGRVYTPEAVYVIRARDGMGTVERLEPEPWRCAADELGDAVKVSPSDATKGVRPRSALSTEFPVSAFDPKVAQSGPERPSGPLGQAPDAPAGADVAGGGEDKAVEVLVVYPSFVREIEGGYEPVLALIDLDIATANEAYAASGVDLRVELTAAVEVEYDRFLDSQFSRGSGLTPWINAIEHLTGRDDGYLDEVHTLRDRYAADLVLMHLGGDVHNELMNYGIGGIAFGVSSVTAETLEEQGFSVARTQYGTAVAHELGHSMGLHHDRYDHNGNDPFPYSHGFTYLDPVETERVGYEKWLGTIMASTAPVGLPVFSNPELVHPEFPETRLGVPGDEPTFEPDGPADAARHLNELGGVVANVRARSDADPCRYRLLGDEVELPATAGTYSVRVETDPECAWTARGGDWVASVLDAEGTGSGEIRYRVDANEGFERPVEVVVAEQVHRVRQAGSRPITPVCERSIRGWLRRQHPDFRSPIPCEYMSFDAAFLASVRHLIPDSPDQLFEGSELKPGDFDGLTGIVKLRFQEVEVLPAELFFGMTGLRILEFTPWFDDPVTLRRIEPGAFQGLPGLVRLDIRGHRLDVMRSGTFDGMPRLRSLQILRNNYLEERPRLATTMEAGAFAGLSRLRSLVFVGHRLVGLDSGVFDGLDELTELKLNDNGLSSLPVGVFEGLPELSVLYLRNNRLSEFPVGLFHGLTRLETLDLWDAGVSHLPAGVFDGLPNLRTLGLLYNRLTRLPTGVFDGLANLEFLSLSNNRLSRLEPGVFGNLSTLETLDLNENGLTRLESGVFEGLSSLRKLFLGGNQLRGIPAGLFEDIGRLNSLILWGNRFGRVPAHAFAGLDWLTVMHLARAGITAFEPGVFDAVPHLDRMTLLENRIRSLEPGTLSGLNLSNFDLRGNPGAPFTFAPTPVPLAALDATTATPAEIAVEIASAAPFEVTATLSASGGKLSRRTVRVPAGEVRSEAVTVTPDGDGPVTVTVGEAPEVGTTSPYQCYDSRRIGLTWGYCYRGVRVAPGPPLVLYGFPDQEWTPG